jgi:hypothetical protein
MRYVDPGRWPAAMVGYTALGALVGLAVTPLQSWAANHLGRPGYGIAIAVNLLLPAAAALVSAWYPRPITTLAGGPLLVGAFVLVRVLLLDLHFWAWSPAFIAARTSPIEVAAAAGCSVVGPTVVLLTRPLRRVGRADDHERCPCGYLLRGLAEGVCPECGRERRITR